MGTVRRFRSTEDSQHHGMPGKAENPGKKSLLKNRGSGLSLVELKRSFSEKVATHVQIGVDRIC